MAPDKTTVAIVYDFDKTLSISEMQDAFIKKIGMTPKVFWKKCGEFAESKGMDKILAYMYMMIEDSDMNKLPLDPESLRRFGSEIEFHPGVLEWFDLMDGLAEELGITIEHYLISSGLKEIVEGTPISGRFRRIYACEYLYDQYHKPIWPKNVVNFTTKTQFLFRINKGVLDIWDDEQVNGYVPHDERPIPFENMIYIGDGMTDVPCMKLVKQFGGYSIGVYDKDSGKVRKMMYDERINLYCKADYRREGELYSMVSEIVKGMAINDPLRRRSYMQYKDSERICGSEESLDDVSGKGPDE